MALVSISEAARLAGTVRSNLYKSYIETGILSITKDAKGKPKIDTAELLRVFGELKQSGQPEEKRTDPEQTGGQDRGQLAIIEMLKQQLVEAKERLKSDIAENGLQEPIWLYQEKILDGRNRHKACIEAGVKPEFRSYGGNEPLKFVLSLNLARRHLDTVDVCKVVDSVADIFERQAKERQIEAGGDKKSEEFRKSVVALVPQAIVTESEEEPAQLPPEPKKPEPKARDLAVAAVGNQVSARTYQDYKKVKTE